MQKGCVGNAEDTGYDVNCTGTPVGAHGMCMECTVHVLLVVLQLQPLALGSSHLGLCSCFASNTGQQHVNLEGHG